jgi:hypothetical protein
MSRNTKNAIQGAVLLLALGVAGCLDATPGDTAGIEEKSSAVVGGMATGARAEVGQFRWLNGPSLFCTGVLIDQSVALTASHCISPDAKSDSTTWSVPGFELRDPQTFFLVDTVSACGVGCANTVPDCNFVAPRTSTDCCHSEMGVCAQAFAIDRVFPQGTAKGTNDIAIAHLVVPQGIAKPASVATMEPKNTMLTDVGYGCVTRTANQGSGIKRFRSYMFTGQNTQFYCSGDSGGPTFFGGLFDNGPIARIVSGYNYTGNDVGADAVVNQPAIAAMVTVLTGAGIAYRPQMQNLGFHATAASNGFPIGSDTAGLRLEGVQIWSPEPGVIPVYRAFVQGVTPLPAAWQAPVSNGQLAGTVGKGLKMEAIEIALQSAGSHSGVSWQVFVHGDGWGDWVSSGEPCVVDNDCSFGGGGVLCAPDGFCAAGKIGGSIEAMAVQLF